MKTYAIIASLFLMVGCAHSSGNSSAVNLDGTWKGEMNYRHTMPRRGTLPLLGKPLYFNFKKTGDSIKGTFDGLPMEDIEIKGKKITFSVTNMFGKRLYKGKIKGDKITLSSKAESPPRNVILGNGLLLVHPLSEKKYWTLERVSNEPQITVE